MPPKSQRYIQLLRVNFALYPALGANIGILATWKEREISRVKGEKKGKLVQRKIQNKGGS